MKKIKLLLIITPVLMLSFLQLGAQSITVVNNQIDEHAESGDSIIVTLTQSGDGEIFKPVLDSAKWDVSYLPEGVYIDTIVRIDTLTVNIYLIGNRTKDYDDNMDCSVTVDTNQIIGYTGSSTSFSDSQTDLFNDDGTDTEVLNVTSINTINEGQEHGQGIALELDDATFNPPLTTSGWSVSNLPTGVTIDTIVFERYDSAVLFLQGYRTVDFDGNLNCNVTIPSTQVDDRTSDLTSTDQFTIVASNEGGTEDIVISTSSTIIEGSESEDTIIIKVINGTFREIIGTGTTKFEIRNTPSGVSGGTPVKVDSVTVIIPLVGNTTQDYDSDITNIQVYVNDDQVEQYGGGDFTNKYITFQAIDETASVSGTILSGALNNESDIIRGNGGTIVITLTGTKFAADIETNDTPAEALLNSISGSTSWNTYVRGPLSKDNITLVNDSTVTITLDDEAIDYHITSNDNITLSVPEAALIAEADAGVSISQQLTILDEETKVRMELISGGNYITESDLFYGGDTLIFTVRNNIWHSTLGTNSTATNNFKHVDNYSTDPVSGEFDNVIDGASFAEITRVNDTVVYWRLLETVDFKLELNEYVWGEYPTATRNPFAYSEANATIPILDSLFMTNQPTRVLISGSIDTANFEQNIQNGGENIILTIENDEWNAGVGTNPQYSDSIINSFFGDSKWSFVQQKQLLLAGTKNISRSGKEVTITLPDNVTGYRLSTDEDIQVIISPFCLISDTVPAYGDKIITIIDQADFPTVSVAGNDTICPDGASKGKIYFVLSGTQPYDLRYTLDGVQQPIVTNITNNVYVLKTDVVGTYAVDSLHDANYAVEAGSPYIVGEGTISHFTLPTPTIVEPINASFSVTTDSVGLVGDPLGGTFSGQGVTASDSTFHPSWLQENNSYNIYYTFTDGNGCTAISPAKSITVTGNSAFILSNDGTEFCNKALPFVVTGYTNKDTVGEFYLDSAGIKLADAFRIVNNVPNDSSATIYPQALYPGTYTVHYEFKKGTENFDIPLSIQIFQNPLGVSLSGLQNVCFGSSQFKVEHQNPVPAGGDSYFYYDYTGPETGITVESANNEATLYPDSISAGTYNLSHYYISQQGCYSDTLTEPFTIFSLPTVSFSMLDYYNYYGEPDTISGDPIGLISNYFLPGGIMSPAGNGMAAFIPNRTGEFTITYYYTDANNCENSYTKDVYVLDTNGYVSGIDPYYCYFGGAPDTITGIITDTTSIAAPDGFRLNGSTDRFTTINDSTIVIYPDSLMAGTNSLTFIYRVGTVPFEINATLTVDSIGVFDFGDDLVATYCSNDDIVDLDPDLPIGGDGVFSFRTSGGGEDGENFDPTDAALGTDTIFCLFTSNISGCSYERFKTTEIVQIPHPNFIISDPCVNEDNPLSIPFINLTNQIDSISEWSWNFDDIASGAANVDTLVNPEHRYTSGGDYDVHLEAVHVNGCINDTTIEIVFESKPDAKFEVNNECYIGEAVRIDNQSNLSKLATDDFTWYISSLSGYSDTVYQDTIIDAYDYQFPGADEYSVTLIQTTTRGCTDTFTNMVFLSPSLDLADSGFYFQDFEMGRQGWVIQQDASSIVNSWVYGESDTVGFGAYSGQHAFYTNSIPLLEEEQSYVVSPCFNLDGIERPMIKMKVKKSFERNRNAAALQYLSGGDQWINIGTFNDGINWYNSFQVINGPAGVSEAWTGEVPFVEDSVWLEVCQSLDVVSSLKGVKLRVAYSSSGNLAETKSNGFAFDDIWIGSRTRRVLLENITNAGSNACASANSKIDDVISSSDIDPADIIDINYHVGYPGEDQMYQDNPDVPGARALFYAVSDVPYVVMDGGIDEMTFDFNGDANSLATTDIMKRVLKDPVFDVQIEAEVTGNTVDINTKVKACSDIDKEEITLYVAIIEEEITDITGGAGETSFRNVVKDMVPDAGGTSFLKSWYKNEVHFSNFSKELIEAYDPSKVKVVAFLQNEETKEVYQAAINDSISMFTGVEGPMAEDIGFALFPNPSAEYVNVVFNTTFNKVYTIEIINTVGAIMLKEKIQPGSMFNQINVNELSNGIYLVRVADGLNSTGIKRLIISK